MAKMVLSIENRARLLPRRFEFRRWYINTDEHE